jgi:protein-S-isoprenylcysteine O-methyltransferase Ste14
MREADGAKVVIKPPLLFLAALGLGSLMSRYLPIGPGLAKPNALAVIVGLSMVVVGFALAIRSVQMFRRAGTHVVPGAPATALVTSGPYRLTRNPIYVGFVLVYLGLSIVLTSIWILVLLLPVLVILQRGVVLREEAYLERRFGEAYDAYAQRVPRWF